MIKIKLAIKNLRLLINKATEILIIDDKMGFIGTED